MNNEETQDKMKQSLAGLSFANHKVFYISSLALFGLWLVFCWQGLTTVVEIWYGNEIFNHGFFIVPGAFYLIYLKRYELLSKPIQTSPLALIVIIPALLLYVIGVAGDIQLFLHAATFTLLPALIWLVIGTAAAKTILFPLVFMLFSIPVGEQLIPYLQEIAADGSVALLRLTGVPLFRSGLYIEIPQGRFLVAEACSGVSFFIASLVVGSLYAYLNLVSVKRRVSFVIISLIFPILANIVRVYGIILIAYWTDMEHAAGADHLIYGWFFFAFVIVCLLGIGELMRNSHVSSHPETAQSAKDLSVSRLSLCFVVSLFATSLVWIELIKHKPLVSENSANVTLQNFTECSLPSFNLSPIFNNPSLTRVLSYQSKEGCDVLLYEAQFDGVNNELVSDLNRVYDPQLWSAVNDRNEDVWVENIKLKLPIRYLSSPNGKVVKFIYWMSVGEQHFNSKVSAKLFEIKQALNGEREIGTITILAVPEHYDLSNKIKSLN